jgi:hypothetical protein
MLDSTEQVLSPTSPPKLSPDMPIESDNLPVTDDLPIKKFYQDDEWDDFESDFTDDPPFDVDEDGVKFI